MKAAYEATVRKGVVIEEEPLVTVPAPPPSGSYQAMPILRSPPPPAFASSDLGGSASGARTSDHPSDVPESWSVRDTLPSPPPIQVEGDCTFDGSPRDEEPPFEEL